MVQRPSPVRLPAQVPSCGTPTKSTCDLTVPDLPAAAARALQGQPVDLADFDVAQPPVTGFRVPLPLNQGGGSTWVEIHEGRLQATGERRYLAFDTTALVPTAYDVGAVCAEQAPRAK